VWVMVNVDAEGAGTCRWRRLVHHHVSGSWVRWRRRIDRGSLQP
jgi:hypothetical protein